MTCARLQPQGSEVKPPPSAPASFHVQRKREKNGSKVSIPLEGDIKPKRGVGVPWWGTPLSRMDREDMTTNGIKT